MIEIPVWFALLTLFFILIMTTRGLQVLYFTLTNHRKTPQNDEYKPIVTDIKRDEWPDE